MQYGGLVLGLLVLLPAPVRADLYMYRDPRGILHSSSEGGDGSMLTAPTCKEDGYTYYDERGVLHEVPLDPGLFYRDRHGVLQLHMDKCPCDPPKGQLHISPDQMPKLIEGWSESSRKKCIEGERRREEQGKCRLEEERRKEEQARLEQDQRRREEQERTNRHRADNERRRKSEYTCQVTEQTIRCTNFQGRVVHEEHR